MLATRLATAAVLIPALLWLIFAGPASAFDAFLLLLVVLGAWEWAGLCRYASGMRALFVGGVVAALLAVQGVAPLPLFAVSVAWWVWAIVEMARAPDGAHGVWTTAWGKPLAGAWVLVPLALSLRALHHGPIGSAMLVFTVILVIALADTCAYFAGRTWGRHKLAPRVSPGKTWEGVAGGLAGALVAAGITGSYGLGLAGPGLLGWMVVATVAVAFSVGGDLVESRYKRAAGVKDSGAILPGHGGVLDRADALAAGAPVFALGWHALHALAGGGV